jgi:hypothetical protein
VFSAASGRPGGQRPSWNPEPCTLYTELCILNPKYVNPKTKNRKARNSLTTFPEGMRGVVKNFEQNFNNTQRKIRVIREIRG